MMKKETVNRYLLITLLCFILVFSIPTLPVYAEENEEPEMGPNEVIAYVLETGDKDFLSEHSEMLPSSMVTELLNANPDNWERMLKDEDQKLSSNGKKLNKVDGTCEGPSGHETYYNLNMSGVVSIMRSNGYSEEEYPYWVREDGVKMLGDYVMVAAAFSIRPRGTIVPTSLGEGIVCDTGGFATRNQYQLDIAVNW